MTDEWKVKEVDLSDNITTILNVPALCKGVYINVKTSDHAIPIMDDTTEKFKVPAQAAAGNAYAFGPARFEDKLIIDPDDSATGNITVVYRELARHN